MAMSRVSVSVYLLRVGIILASVLGTGTEGGWYILSGVLSLGFGYTKAGVLCFAFDLALIFGCKCMLLLFFAFLLEEMFGLVLTCSTLLYLAVLAFV